MSRSLWSQDSFLSIGSKNSVLSIGSIGSACSIGSVASFASILSMGSFASIGSAFSSQSRWPLMSHRAEDAIQATHAQSRSAAPMVVLGFAATAALAYALRKRRK